MGLLAFAGVIARVQLVNEGVLFGATAVFRVELVIAALLLGALTLLQYAHLRPQGGMAEAPAVALTGTVGLLGLAVALPVGIGSATNLVAPATPGWLPVKPCAGVPVTGSPFVGVTLGELGTFARFGPGISYEPSGRFEKNCAIGFAGYCIGEPIQDAYFKTWNDSRWLRIDHHDDAVPGWIARSLSGESRDPQFVSAAYLASLTPDTRLPALGSECQGRAAAAGRATVEAPAQVGRNEPITFEVRATHATNLGVAVWIPPEHLRGGHTFRTVGAGAAAPGGAPTKIVWKSPVTVGDLVQPRTVPVTITALATSCLGTSAPAPGDIWRAIAYSVTPEGTLTRVPAPQLDSETQRRLIRQACDGDALPPEHLKHLKK